MVGNALEYVLKITLRIDLVELAGLDERINDGVASSSSA